MSYISLAGCKFGIFNASKLWNSSSISNKHTIVKAVNEIGIPVYGSPTLSDQTKLSCPSIKIGPGDSSRSHTADEFIYIEEIEKGCEIMKKLIKKLLIWICGGKIKKKMKI